MITRLSWDFYICLSLENFLGGNMLKNTVKTLVLLVALTLAAISSYAQSQESFQKQIEEMVALAEQTATFENGKIKTVKILVPGEGEKLITFEHASDGKSFNIIDDQNQKIQVFLVDKNQIGSVKMPNGAEAVFVYKETSNGFRTLEKIVFKENGTEFDGLVPAPNNCYEAAERAGAAAAVALGICAGNPGSTACWSATATAAYLTYLAWRACRVLQ